MRSYTLLALIAATMMSNTEAVKLQDCDATHRLLTQYIDTFGEEIEDINWKLDNITEAVGAGEEASAGEVCTDGSCAGDGDIKDQIFDSAGNAVDNGSAGAAAGLAANIFAPGSGAIV